MDTATHEYSKVTVGFLALVVIIGVVVVVVNMIGDSSKSRVSSMDTIVNEQMTALQQELSSTSPTP